MLDFIRQEDCTGCGACSNICPVHCIDMVKGNGGFLYPTANETCIKCNKCRQVCPVYSHFTEKKPEVLQKAYAAVSQDYNVWKESSSGGAFSEICRAFGTCDTVIFGAEFQGLDVVHSYSIGAEQISKFRHSKYVQSEIGDTYKEAEEFLKQVKKVIFSGTPCQIAGLRSYLKRDYENLLCIDLICHGVGSPEIFRNMIQRDAKKHSSEVDAYTFRVKKIRFGNYEPYTSFIHLKNNKQMYIEKDAYNRLFLNQLVLRKSCGENCKFRNSNRMGDLTIGDFKNKNRLLPERSKDFRNYSTIVVNSNKGLKLMELLKSRMEVYSIHLDDLKQSNPLFFTTTQGNPMRDKFFEDYAAGNDIEKYIPKDSKKQLLKKWIPFRLKATVNQLLKRK